MVGYFAIGLVYTSLNVDFAFTYEDNLSFAAAANVRFIVEHKNSFGHEQPRFFPHLCKWIFSPMVLEFNFIHTVRDSEMNIGDIMKVFYILREISSLRNYLVVMKSIECGL